MKNDKVKVKKKPKRTFFNRIISIAIVQLKKFSKIITLIKYNR